MRLFPTVPFSSKISQTRSIEVEGIAIPAKTNVMWMKTAVGMNEALFADAARFNPGRFAVGPAGERPAESIATAMPFGTGVRHCIGRHQAEHLCTQFLSAVLREFELVPLHDVAVTFSATVSVTPSSVPVRLVPRDAHDLTHQSLQDARDKAISALGPSSSSLTIPGQPDGLDHELAAESPSPHDPRPAS